MNKKSSENTANPKMNSVCATCKNGRSHTVVVVVLLLCGVCRAEKKPPLTSFVNIRAGTSNNNLLSTGNTLPIIALPNGFNHWSPMTTLTPSARFYSEAQPTFYGVRCTHAPSPWIGDYGWFYVTAQTGPILVAQSAYSIFNAQASTFLPHHFRTNLPRFQTTLELAPTQHGAVFRVVFPSVEQSPGKYNARRIELHMPLQSDKITANWKSGDMSAFTSVNEGGVPYMLEFLITGVTSSTVDWTNLDTVNSLVAIVVDLMPDTAVSVKDFQINNIEQVKDSVNISGVLHRGSFAKSNKRELQNLFESIFSKGNVTSALKDKNILAKLKLATSTQSIDKFTTFVRLQVSPPPIGASVRGGIGRFEFSSSTTEVIVRVATSFISMDMANIALQRELLNNTFESIRDAAQDEWETLLSRTKIQDATEDATKLAEKKQMFYTGLYHALLWPRNITEIDASGNLVHYSPYDSQGRVFPGQLVTDHGFWDAYRTIYPLLNLVYSDRAGNILNGWVNAYRESGWLPKWASPGFRDSMSGCFGDVSLIDGILKNIPGLDVQGAIEAISHDTLTVPLDTNLGAGRSGLDLLNQFGFIPANKFAQSVSRTLDDSFIDHAVSDLCQAKHLDESPTFTLNCTAIRERSLRASTVLFDPSTKFMRGHDAPGSWLGNFDEYDWSYHYTEGGPWHYRFGVPHDTDTLVSLYGGKSQLHQELDRMFATNIIHATGYGSDNFIHEMHEAQVVQSLGQYDQGNQPSHHILVSVSRTLKCKFLLEQFV
eukprot:c11817_g1_i3.p1 GENE.c11817_g1_i3~~c11817_g1_i3.p1  ORF type:complete len:769 (+),score=175.75 c11817_g1_i3:150-2456(+)